jgi:hypothetical protein
MPYGTITTNDLRQQYAKDIDKEWFKELARKTKYYMALLNDKAAAGPGESWVEGTMSEFPIAPKYKEGQKPELFMPADGNKVTRSYVKAGLETMLTDEALQDDVHGNLKQLAPMLVDSVIERLEYDAAALIQLGTTTTLAEDGNALFYATHRPIGNAALAINNLSTADLGPVALQAAFEYGDNMVGENGFKRPIKLTGIIGAPALKWVANDLLKSAGRVWQYNGSDANGNLLLSKGGVTPGTAGDIAPNGQAQNLFAPKNGIVDDWSIFLDPYITDADCWCAVYEGYKFSLRWKWQPKLENDGNFDIGAKVYKASARYAMACNKYRYVYGSAGA